MRRSGGVRSEAARLLGISRFQLLRRMEKYGIRAEDGDE
jgi:DNA-binding NtrC family response regulator